MAAAYSSEAEELVLGRDVSIGDGTRISGGRIVIQDLSRVGRNVEIHVDDELVLGRNSKVGDFSIIRGRKIHTAREFYANHHAEIGGGSCFEGSSQLEIGYWFHIGSFAIVNTAMAVRIGNEVGLGRMTNIYTHGAYLSEIDGFPVQFAPVTIGDRVWIPSATVNPGVSIGDDVVIGAGSVVTHDIPSGSLAMGVPCRVVKARAYPSPLGELETLRRVHGILDRAGVAYEHDSNDHVVIVSTACFDLKDRTIEGHANGMTERARDLLRRHGLRFKVDVVENEYCPWSK